MLLEGLMQNKSRTQRRRIYDENTAAGAKFKCQNAEPAVPEMTLHVPCFVAGRTACGSRWKGKAKTISLSLFGANLLLPEHVDLEGELSILFRIPSALKVLFSKDVFRVKAEINRSDTDGHWPAPLGQKVVHVVFSHPLRFALWGA